MSVSDVVVIDPEGIPTFVGEITGHSLYGGDFKHRYTDLVEYNLAIETFRENNIDFEAHDMAGLKSLLWNRAPFSVTRLPFRRLPSTKRRRTSRTICSAWSMWSRTGILICNARPKNAFVLTFAFYGATIFVEVGEQ